MTQQALYVDLPRMEADRPRRERAAEAIRAIFVTPVLSPIRSRILLSASGFREEDWSRLVAPIDHVAAQCCLCLWSKPHPALLLPLAVEHANAALVPVEIVEVYGHALGRTLKMTRGPRTVAWMSSGSASSRKSSVT